MNRGRIRPAIIAPALLSLIVGVAAVSTACGGGSSKAASTPTAMPLPSQGAAAQGTPRFRGNSTPGALETARAEGTPFPFGTPGAFGTPGPFGTPGARGGGMFLGGIDSSLATFLGISQDQLQSELSAQSATLATVAQAHGKSRDDLKAFLTQQIQANADQAVANEQMTQDQANQMVQTTTSNLDSIIDGSGFRGFGRPPGAQGTPGPQETPPATP